MKSKTICMGVVLLYVLNIAVISFSFPQEIKMGNTYPAVFCQSTHDQINHLEKELHSLENGIREHRDKLFILQGMIEFIRDTNPRVNDADLYLISTTAYREARRYNLDPLILMAIMYQESRYIKNAVGAASEIGLMQVMPSTAQEMARQMDMGSYNLYDIQDNIQIGTRYLIYCLNRTTNYADSSNRNMKYGLAAYNRGLGIVLQDLEAGRNPKNRYPEEVLGIHTRMIEEYL